MPVLMMKPSCSSAPSMPVDDEQVVPRQKPACCRRLSFDDIPASTRAPRPELTAQDRLRETTDRKTAEYNFDFVNDRPLSGDGEFNWVAVDAREMPAFYRERVFGRSDHHIPVFSSPSALRDGQVPTANGHSGFGAVNVTAYASNSASANGRSLTTPVQDMSESGEWNCFKGHYATHEKIFLKMQAGHRSGIS